MIAGLFVCACALLLLCLAQWLKQNELEDRLEHIYELFEAAAEATSHNDAALLEYMNATVRALKNHDERLCRSE